MLPVELLRHGQHVMTVCNACRYCEQFCPVFPAMERRLTFARTDLMYLANLCHNCGECLYACQYAPPHEFGINVPRTLAEIRGRSYEEYCWPRSLGSAFRHNNLGTGLGLAAGLIAVMFVSSLALNPAALWSLDASADFYAVVPHEVMVALFGGVSLFVLVALGIGGSRFLRDINQTVRLKPDTTYDGNRAALRDSGTHVVSGFSRTVAAPRDSGTHVVSGFSRTVAAPRDSGTHVVSGFSRTVAALRDSGTHVVSGFSRTVAALRDALTLRHLHGGGIDCTSELDARTPWRRWFHHSTFYGFMLCFASTSVAAVYHSVFGWYAPHGYTSLPVVLGAAGGLGLLVGPAGLAVVRRQRDPGLGDPARGGLDTSFLALLFLTSLTGLALLFLRHLPVMGALLIIHLGTVLALFLTLPYGKFVHGLYRVLSLIKYHEQSK